VSAAPEAVATAEAVAPAVVVATTCPSCGAPLDVGETANTTACGHCNTRLVVTGRGRVLAYQIAPSVPPGEARSLVRFAQANDGRAEVGIPQLHLFPYYRLTGLEIRWKSPEEPRDDSLARHIAALPEAARIAAQTAAARKRLTKGAPIFEGRWFERTVSACAAADGLVSYSLGVRTSVLRLDLFRPAELEQAQVVAPTLTPAAALDTPDYHPDSDTLHLTVLHRIVSLVYFPFWVVEVRSENGRHAAIVDGTSAAIVTSDADPAHLAGLVAAEAGTPSLLGFRRLLCPNCGWDLPADPREVVFHCGSCQRAWRLAPDSLEPMPYALAAPPARAAREALRHLPLWIVERRGGGFDRRVFAPAFRFRHLKRLVELGRNLSHASPPLGEAEPLTKALDSCHLDAHDAVALADFIVAGTTLEKGRTPASAKPVPPERLTLAWLPFGSDSYALRDLYSATSLPKQLLL
jgi:predicted RNA-binding Zn-ribbon protein involved in translation (DUF1610 family)